MRNKADIYRQLHLLLIRLCVRQVNNITSENLLGKYCDIMVYQYSYVIRCTAVAEHAKSAAWKKIVSIHETTGISD